MLCPAWSRRVASPRSWATSWVSPLACPSMSRLSPPLVGVCRHLPCCSVARLGNMPLYQPVVSMQEVCWRTCGSPCAKWDAGYRTRRWVASWPFIPAQHCAGSFSCGPVTPISRLGRIHATVANGEWATVLSAALTACGLHALLLTVSRPRRHVSEFDQGFLTKEAANLSADGFLRVQKNHLVGWLWMQLCPVPQD